MSSVHGPRPGAKLAYFHWGGCLRFLPCENCIYSMAMYFKYYSCGSKCTIYHRLCQLFSSDLHEKGTHPIQSSCQRMHSPICLYTRIELATGSLASLNWGRVSFNFARLKDYCGRGAEERWGSKGLPPEKL